MTKIKNKIVVITQGEIAEIGTHEELLQIEDGAYKTLYNMRLKKQEVIQ
jgi:ABC-type multidrug transport system fused ATPase/permease subunit